MKTCPGARRDGMLSLSETFSPECVERTSLLS